MGIRAAARHHAGGVRCLGCGATVPDDVGPIHAYMTAAPGCWARYCLLEDWKASLSGEEAIGVVCDLVDCFAVQHATNPERRNRQSVGVHLEPVLGIGAISVGTGTPGADRHLGGS